MTKAKSAKPMTRIKTIDFSRILPNMAMSHVFFIVGENTTSLAEKKDVKWGVIVQEFL